MEPILEVFFAYIVGAALRTSYDYLWKALEEGELKWDVKYTASFIVSVILSFLATPLSLLTVDYPIGTAYIFLTSLLLGFAINHVVNKPISYLSKVTKSGR